MVRSPWLRSLRRAIRLVLLALLLVIIIGPERLPLDQERTRLTALVGLNDFDFVTWELQALGGKAAQAVVGSHQLLSADTQHDIVTQYFALAGDIRRLDRELERLYAADATPGARAAELTQSLAETRRAFNQIQFAAEAVLEAQVTTVLREKGFGLLGAVTPPVQSHMTPLPYMLIVSPRDRIERRYSLPLKHGLTVPEKQRLEDAIAAELDLSALVVPIGGLSVYPAMIVENGNLNWTIATIAHEWVHHWLAPHPLGRNYFAGGQVQTINETVASIVGDEIGAEVVARFYPEWVPDPPPPVVNDAAEPEPPAFNFGAEMAATRIEAERLLAAGEIEAAEAYMEVRRQLFVENGYLIRRLNQAYFAFYGAYADQPGATGDDPVGPTVLAVRAASPSIHAFLNAVAAVDTLEELEGLLQEQ